jgi:hypothetical protein
MGSVRRGANFGRGPAKIHDKTSLLPIYQMPPADITMMGAI